MQALSQPKQPSTPVRGKSSSVEAQREGDLADAFAWATLYNRRPASKMTLYELERLVAKRMDLLAFVDQQLNSPHAKSLDDVLGLIKNRIVRERRLLQAAAEANANSGGGGRNGEGTPFKQYSGPNESALDQQYDDEGGGASAYNPHSVKSLSGGVVVAEDSYAMTKDEDLISHLLCRFAFCMDDKWRKWFARTEEALLRARILAIGDQNSVAQRMLTLNRVAARPLTAEEGNNPMVIAFMQWNATKTNMANMTNPHKYLAVPMSLVPRLVRDRRVIVVKGTAIISEEHALELALTIFKRSLNAGLFEAYQKRVRQQDTADPLLWGMLDAFLTRYVADQTDNLKESKEGTVKPGDVQYEANAHMPLCMRRIDTHLRGAHHLKHTGRLMYGLFLKQIGLSMEDAMILFSTLMSVKGGGSREAFEKSPYGYNIRHNYGKEGKKTSYTSMGCSTIIGQPALNDANDCHGCPFKFRDETAIRRLLQQDQINPLSRELPKVRPTNGDIEEIIADAKAQHYTRACYKYFVATHPSVRRDTLFRSPYEYYSISKDAKREHEEAKGGGAAASAGGAAAGAKRGQTGSGYDESRENATRSRHE